MKILDARVKPQDFVRTWWCAVVEAGVTREEVLKTDFWAYVSMKFKRGERVEITTDDEKWMGEYRIMDCDRTFAKLKELHYWDFSTKGKISSKLDFEHYWGGQYGLHGIRRISDGAMMVNKLNTEKDALAWLTENIERLKNGDIPA